MCTNVKKGMGAFATRKLIAGGVLGVYFGELLTMRQHVLRHGWRSTRLRTNQPKQNSRKCVSESRDAALTSGQPSGGANNGSAYCFSLFPEALKDALGSTTLPRRIAYIDCEDPNRSTWCRYVNHAPAGDPACNAIPRCDPVSALVWLEATRDIEPGEELHFDYGDVYKWDAAPEREVGRRATTYWYRTLARFSNSVPVSVRQFLVRVPGVCGAAVFTLWSRELILHVRKS